MKINARNEEPLTINNTALKEVDEFVYLGSKITSDGNSEKDVDSRISKAKGAFAALHSVWKINAHQGAYKTQNLQEQCICIPPVWTVVRSPGR